MIAMVAGVLLGLWVHYNGSAAQIEGFTGVVNVITDIFLRLIKMIIAPLVFSTLVVGIAKLGDIKAVGRIGGKTLLWFLCASFLSLLLGLLIMNSLSLGSELNLPLPAAGASTGIDQAPMSFKAFFTHIFPRSVFESMANNEILQIVVFAVFFGIATASIGEEGKIVIKALDVISRVVLRVTGLCDVFCAGLAALAAIASVMAEKGPELLVTYGKFILTFYLGILGLWLILLLMASVYYRQAGDRAGDDGEGHDPAGLQHGQFGSRFSPADRRAGEFRLSAQDRQFRTAAGVFLQPGWKHALYDVCVAFYRAGVWGSFVIGAGGIDAAGADANEQRRRRRTEGCPGRHCRDPLAVQYPAGRSAALTRHRPDIGYGPQRNERAGQQHRIGDGE